MAPDQKVTTTKELQAFATTLAQAWLQAENIREVYSDRGFSGTITNEDIEATTGLVSDQVANGITLAEQFIFFLKKQAVVVNDYLSTVNQLRTDI